MAGSAFFIRGAETQKTHAELSLNIVWKNIIFEMFWEAKIFITEGMWIALQMESQAMIRPNDDISGLANAG